MASDFDLNVSVQNYESDILFDLNEIPSEEEEESVTNGYEDIPISPGIFFCYLLYSLKEQC